MSPDPLREAHRELRKSVREARRAFAQSPLSRFVRAMREAMDDFRTARSEGVSREDGIRGIEAVLRDVWPKEASKFAPKCSTCDDTGWRELFCDDRMRCGREWCAKRPETQHAYVEPCHCAEGEKKRKRTWNGSEHIGAVGRTAKKRGSFSRIGQ